MRPYLIIDTTKSFSKLPDNEIASAEATNWQKELYTFIRQWINDDQHITMRTSGSTGIPQKLEMPKSAMRASAMRTLSAFKLTPGMTTLLCLPTSFIAGKMQIVRAFVGELKLIAVKPSINPLENIDTPIDFAAFTPMQMKAILESCDKQLNLLKTVILGGGKVDEMLNKSLQNQTFDAWETYGMTETLSHIALRKLNGTDRAMGFNPLPGIAIGTDKRGCVTINMPEANSKSIITNDLVEFLADGSFIIKGRIDNIINSGGIKISPEQVEQKISHLIDKPFILSSINDCNLGEQLVLVLETDPYDATNLLNLIKKHASKYEQPARAFFMREFPRTASGKIQRFAVKYYFNNS